jgi:hypothetical protein
MPKAHLLRVQMAMLDFQGRLLARAADIAGGRPELAGYLGVSEHTLSFWMQGKARIPGRVFLAATDLVLADDEARAAEDRRSAPRQALIRRPANDTGLMSR